MKSPKDIFTPLLLGIVLIDNCMVNSTDESSFETLNFHSTFLRTLIQQGDDY